MAKEIKLADIQKASEAGDAVKTMQLVQQRKETLQQKREEFATQLRAIDDELSSMATFAYKASKSLLGDLGVRITQGSGASTSSPAASSGSSKRGAKKVDLSAAEAAEIQGQVADILAKKPKTTFECKELAAETDFKSGEIRAACDTPEATEMGIAKVDSKGPWPVFQKA
jgi:flagellar capping protein FliD